MLPCRRKSSSYGGAAAPCRAPALVVVVVMLFLPSVVRNAAAAELYPFQSHQRLQRGDEQMVTVRLESPLLFLQRNYSGITVSGRDYVATPSSREALQWSSAVLLFIQTEIDVNAAEIEVQCELAPSFANM